MLRWTRLVRPQDFVWVLVFTVLFYTLPYRDLYDTGPLVGLAILQILEPKIPALASTRGRILWIALKVILGFVLIGFTGSIESNYWPVLLLPVVSAATTFGMAGSLAFTALACGAYLVYIFIKENSISSVVPIRVGFLVMVGNLANTLAEDLRIQSEKHRRAAEQLAEANLHIQQAEEAVRRSDRLAALGQLSAGLAHELRNPLGTMKASAEMLEHSVSAENEVAREVAGFISTEVDRTNALITRFLQFARPLQLHLEKADLAQTLDRAVALVEREVQGVAIYKNYEPGIRPFPFDAELLERVFYNLVLNAVQATEAGGAVTLKTRAAGGMVDIAVIDRGTGIDAKQRESIFNPFFTTKPQGVGLGLAIVSKIVDEHGGKITVESEPGKGSVFHVLLPVEARPPQTAGANPA